MATSLFALSCDSLLRRRSLMNANSELMRTGARDARRDSESPQSLLRALRRVIVIVHGQCSPGWRLEQSSSRAV